jgi:hypothetical protein
VDAALVRTLSVWAAIGLNGTRAWLRERRIVAAEEAKLLVGRGDAEKAIAHRSKVSDRLLGFGDADVRKPMVKFDEQLPRSNARILDVLNTTLSG